jgi:hypothetical protein
MLSQMWRNHTYDPQAQAPHKRQIIGTIIMMRWLRKTAVDEHASLPLKALKMVERAMNHLAIVPTVLEEQPGHI